ncbi:OBAP family protein [Cronobacter turicensis]|uniref:OBAP family protein n=1 Tax=Cronobacter turicensis TaxID=413502 RepID=UPI0024AFE9AE|nr:OBAP family protein [Cronobacter turicensis]MDI7406523.1 OBAP family protein [Cronobacter turicensis]
MKLQRALKITLLPLLSVAFLAQAEKDTPPGADKSTTTNLLETGSAVLQSNAPLKGFDIYLVGFHPMKEIPEKQMEAHHYCHQVNQDFAQCVLFDGNSKDARMNGLEYIISEKLFNKLPEQEKQYWHPHNGEILSGQLIAPGIPAPVEHRLMQDKMNSYGKTWHVWHTGGLGDKGDALPLGPPMLAWSFNRDGEAKPEMVSERDKKLGVNTEEIRRSRADLEKLAKPQSGVDALKGQFKGDIKDIPGVVDSNAASEKK